jgi:hypothetical protein
VPRRVSLPAADELFRTTGGSAVQPSAPAHQNHSNGEEPSGRSAPSATRVPGPAGEADPDGTSEGTAEDSGDDSGAGDRAEYGGHSEHSAVEEGEDSAGTGATPGGTPSAEGTGEHTGPERAGGDAQSERRTTVPGQGSPQGAAGRAPGGPAVRGVEAPPRPGTQAAKAGLQPQSQPQSARAESRNRQPPDSSSQRRGGRGANRRPSGRERHDEKITVYVSAEELMDLEHARLVLRGEHGLAVDRGRIVREAVAVVLADLESRGDASILVRRLRGR